ncbi:MAG: hypothetical protein ACRC18_07130 [Cetobacterium sp.]
MKQKIDVTLKGCEVIFEEDRIIILEHLKDSDQEFNLEDIMRKFENQTFNMTLSTTNDI